MKCEMEAWALKHEMEDWWWGVGTSVLHFDAREGGDDCVSIRGRVVVLVVVVNNVVCSMLMFIYITKCILYYYKFIKSITLI